MFDIYQLAILYPDAYSALPEPYQADNCLAFEIQNCKLYAFPCEDQKAILGDWRACYHEEKKVWR